MSEATYYIGKRKGFTTVYRSVAQDSRLSLKARGLFLLIQSLPDDWKFTVSGMATLAGTGVRQIRNALNELESVGYLVREQSHADGGTFGGNVWILQEEAPAPLCQNSTTADAENPPLCRNAPAPFAPAQNGTLRDKEYTDNTPLTPQGGAACDFGKETAVADGKPAVPRAAASHCRRPRYDPAWKPDRFERFWNFYKSRSAGRPIGNRIAAAKAWDKLKADDNLINLMGLALMRQTEGEMWRRGVGVPYASSWLNKRYWENDAPESPAPDSAPADSFLPDDLIGG